MLRRHGFGIHSPFAYRFVVDVVSADDDAYYDYVLLSDRRQRLLYRVAVFLQPSEIIEVGGGNAVPALMACPPRLRHAPVWTMEDVVRLAVAGPDCSHDDIAKLLADGWVLYAEHSLRKMNLSGMKFHVSRCVSIIFPWSHLPEGTYYV